MQYRRLGKTGFDISILGFGAMRLPMTEIDSKTVVDEDVAVAMIRRAFESGVNYIDTAYMYCGGQSEVVVGKALKGWRDRVRLSTKLPMGKVRAQDDLRRILDEQMRKLDVSVIDFYHFHGLRKRSWDEQVLPLKLIDEMEKARSDGLIRHISFSFHDEPENMRVFVDSGVFSSLLCQYNFLDRRNAESMAYASEKGVGVMVMGPVGGGRLASPMEYLTRSMDTESGTPEMALRFVLANPSVSCALSGMSAMQQVEENLATASSAGPLSSDETRVMEEALGERKELADLYCTGCEYCMPCPHEVNIPVCFESMINHRVYGFTGEAIRRYRAIGDRWLKGKRADACAECGECEPKCPQSIPVREQLKEVAREFDEYLE